ncbi:MAG: HD domain-containing phosphohydrolase [Acetivibrio sp.]
MKICFNDMIYGFSYGLDSVEHELIGVSTRHSERVAYFSIQMGKYFHLEEEKLLDLAACAALHDNALTEYIENEYTEGVDILQKKEEIKLGKHCIFGERNVQNLPFFGDIKGAILYHHENADGSGSFGKKTEETPLFARIIHLADQIDALFDFSVIAEAKFDKLKRYLKEQEGKLFDTQVIEAFFREVPYEKLQTMEDEGMDVILKKELPLVYREYTGEQLIQFSSFYGRIVDYKSKFTKNHSMGLADKCMIMAQYYGYNKEKQEKLYFAGAVHDVGKLVIPRDILEKPDRLTKNEYKIIQSHASYTYEILNKIQGLEEITSWASNHHEKLNGKGYPLQKTADELGQEERLMACLDIYQALTEKRPYKNEIQHKEAMKILNKMVISGELDSQIVKDMDEVFGEEKNYKKE